MTGKRRARARGIGGRDPESGSVREGARWRRVRPAPGARWAGAALAVALAAAVAPQAAAWEGAGHQVVAAIAWEAMHPDTRRRAVELLASAPVGSGLAEMAPAGAPAGGTGRRHFLLAATWPDEVRGTDSDRPTWHWVNRFWRDTPDGPVEVPPPGEQPKENVRERLQALPRTLGDARAPAGERAVALAWVLHLVGDVHQPLHTSARITSHPDELRGDRGGNRFELHVVDPARGERTELHAYWDRLLSANLPRRRGESTAAWIDRAAAELARRHPRSSLGDLAPGDVEAWVEEGFATARATVYRHGLQRGRRPPERYRRAAWSAAAPALVRAGHRLGALLDEALANGRDEGEIRK
jgi:hypothetical protein